MALDTYAMRITCGRSVGRLASGQTARRFRACACVGAYSRAGNLVATSMNFRIGPRSVRPDKNGLAAEVAILDRADLNVVTEETDKALGIDRDAESGRDETDQGEGVRRLEAYPQWDAGNSCQVHPLQG